MECLCPRGNRFRTGSPTNQYTRRSFRTCTCSHTDNYRHRCYVQLGAFQNQQWAEQQVAEVALLGIKAQSYKTRTAQGDIYQVRVESLNYQQAQTILQRLKQNNINAFVATKP